MGNSRKQKIRIPGWTIVYNYELGFLDEAGKVKWWPNRALRSSDLDPESELVRVVEEALAAREREREGIDEVVFGMGP